MFGRLVLASNVVVVVVAVVGVLEGIVKAWQYKLPKEMIHTQERKP